MDTLVLWGNEIWAWFGVEDNQNRAQAIAAVVAVLLSILGAVFVVLRSIGKAALPKQTESAPKALVLPTGDVLSMDQHLKILDKREEMLTAKLTAAHDQESDLLSRQLSALREQREHPDASLAEAQKRIKDLEALLDREANDIGPDRIAEARAALEQGDYSVADDIFAEIGAREDLAVQRAARAAFGRGEVAEAEIRWADAAAHYARAAQLDPSFDALQKASEYTQRSGDYDQAARYSGDLIALAKDMQDQVKLSDALNEHAVNNEKLGIYSEAETLYQQALEIDRATIGEGHPDYATRLNNLANVVRAQGRYDEAEALYQQAMEIDRATIGEGHPDYATRLNNLAEVLRAQGRYGEAEALYQQALKIDRATIGEGHPDYATRLNNLAGVVWAQGRYGEAEALYQQALEIGRATIGEGHPDYATHLNNLANVVKEQGRYGEAEALYMQALEIDRATIGEGHPDYAIDLSNLADVVKAQGRIAEARGLYEQALAIWEQTLPSDHHYIQEVKDDLANLPNPE